MSLDHQKWIQAEFLIDSGADLSIVSFVDCQDKSKDCGTTVRVIGGSQSIGPKKKYQIRFSCDKDKVYDVELNHATLPSKGNFIILGRDFLSQFGSTELKWDQAKIRLGES